MSQFEAVKTYELAMNFWHLTFNASQEVIKSGNPSCMLYDGWGSPTDEELDDYMKWSDVYLIEPILFNFYHGIELSLKSLLIAKGINTKNSHKLSALLDDVIKSYSNVSVISFYRKYIVHDDNPQILKDFCKYSNVTMDLYFQSLKYPTSTKGAEFDHSILSSHGETGITLFEEISKDIKNTKRLIRELILGEYKAEFT